MGSFGGLASMFSLLLRASAPRIQTPGANGGPCAGGTALVYFGRPAYGELN